MKTKLDLALEEHLRTGDYEVLLRPLLAADLFVAGAEFPLYDRPVFYAVPDDETGAPILTASERRPEIAALPGVVPLVRTGVKLILEMDDKQGLTILQPQGAVAFDAGQVAWFREAIRLDPSLRNLG